MELIILRLVFGFPRFLLSPFVKEGIFLFMFLKKSNFAEESLNYLSLFN